MLFIVVVLYVGNPNGSRWLRPLAYHIKALKAFLYYLPLHELVPAEFTKLRISRDVVYELSSIMSSKVHKVVVFSSTKSSRQRRLRNWLAFKVEVPHLHFDKREKKRREIKKMRSLKRKGFMR